MKAAHIENIIYINENYTCASNVYVVTIVCTI